MSKKIVKIFLFVLVVSSLALRNNQVGVAPVNILPSTCIQGSIVLLTSDNSLRVCNDGNVWSLIGGSVVGAGYTIFVQASSSSPVDATTVFFGSGIRNPITAPEGANKVHILKDGTITGATIYVYSGGSSGSNEAWSLYIRKNSTTDFLIQTLSVSTNERVFTNLSMNIPMVVGDYFEMKGVQPTWVTNPTTTTYNGQILVQ